VTTPERTSLTRATHKASRDRAALDALLDTVHIGHFGIATDDGPLVLPTAVARDGDQVLAHGSTGSRWMRHLADGAPTALAVTSFDGVVVARSAFESSMHYRSAVIFGRCVPLPDDEKAAALEVITDTLLPGRSSEVRQPTARELAATLVLALPIAEWSLKISSDWPDDPPADVAGSAWAGVVPAGIRYGAPSDAPDLRSGIALPASVTTLIQGGLREP
jgi:uncharacterized protein